MWRTNFLLSHHMREGKQKDLTPVIGLIDSKIRKSHNYVPLIKHWLNWCCLKSGIRYIQQIYSRRCVRGWYQRFWLSFMWTFKLNPWSNLQTAVQDVIEYGVIFIEGDQHLNQPILYNKSVSINSSGIKCAGIRSMKIIVCFQRWQWMRSFKWKELWYPYCTIKYLLP